MVLEYGPVIMAFKLEQVNVINSRKYEQIYNLNVSDKFKSQVLSAFVFYKFWIREYLQYKKLFDSDRKWWHLSIRFRQRS